MAALYMSLVCLIGEMSATSTTRKRSFLASGGRKSRVDFSPLLPTCNSPKRVIRVCGRSFAHSDTNDAIPSNACPNAFNRGSKPFWMGSSRTPDGSFASTAALS